LTLWVFGRFLAKGASLAVLANAAALAIACLILWFSGSLSDVWLDVIAQAVWLTVDLIRFRSKTAEISN
jgi:hypothetical protein